MKLAFLNVLPNIPDGRMQGLRLFPLLTARIGKGGMVKGRSPMTTTLQPGLMQVLSWGEWFLMATVFILLIVAGLQAIRFAKYAYKVMRGE